MVVRIEIKKPRPAVDFKEWDGLVRLLFNRKHKTARSLMTQKTTLAMLEENVRTHRALTGGVGGGGDGAMDTDNGDLNIKVRLPGAAIVTISANNFSSISTPHSSNPNP